MLTLTDNAVQAINSLTSQSGMPEEAGVRIAQHPATSQNSGGTEFDLALASRPDVGDEVVETHDARVFLPEDSARVLTDQVLDALITEQGRVEFRLVPHPVV